MARLPASLELTIAALVLASACPALGFLAALRPDSLVDQLVRVFCTLAWRCRHSFPVCC